MQDLFALDAQRIRTEQRRFTGAGPCIFLPWNRALILWDAVSVLALAYTALVMPTRLAFAQSTDGSGTMDVVEMIIDVFFLVDILRNARTAYYDYYGTLIVAPRAVMVHYLKTWFALDLIASFPIDWCLAGSVDGQTEAGSQGLLLLRLCKLGKLLRLVRLTRVSGRLRAAGRGVGALRHSDVVWLSARAFALCCVVHWSACLLALVAGGATTPRPGSWIARSGLASTAINDTTILIYAASLHHATLLLGGGEGLVEAEQPEDFLLATLLWVIGILIVASTGAALVVRSLSHSRVTQRAYNDRIESLELWMAEIKLPPAQRAKLRMYYEVLFPAQRCYDESAIMRELSGPLRQEVRAYDFHSKSPQGLTLWARRLPYWAASCLH